MVAILFRGIAPSQCTTPLEWPPPILEAIQPTPNGDRKQFDTAVTCALPDFGLQQIQLITVKPYGG